MSDFVVREAIVPALAANTREGVIREMVQSLQSAGYFREGDLEDIVRHILRREQLGSTGIGRAIAIPHTKHAGIDRLVGTLALSKEGVPFDAIDGEAVSVFVLLVSPQDRPGDHLRALENVVKTLRDDGIVRALKACTSRDDIWRLLLEAGPGWEPQR